MKTTILFFLSILFSIGLYAQTGTISNPEMNVLYLGYDNIIVPMIPSNEELILEVSGAIARKNTLENSKDQRNEYTIRPFSKKNVTIKLSGMNENLEIKNYGTFQYIVKEFPAAQVQTTSISKASGARLKVGMDASSPLSAIFYITGGEIIIENESIHFEGDIISPSLIQKAKTGMNVKIKVNYIRFGNEQFPNTITSILEVVN